MRSGSVDLIRKKKNLLAITSEKNYVFLSSVTLLFFKSLFLKNFKQKLKNNFFFHFFTKKADLAYEWKLRYTLEFRIKTKKLTKLSKIQVALQPFFSFNIVCTFLTN